MLPPQVDLDSDTIEDLSADEPLPQWPPGLEHLHAGLRHLLHANTVSLDALEPEATELPINTVMDRLDKGHLPYSALVTDYDATSATRAQVVLDPAEKPAVKAAEAGLPCDVEPLSPLERDVRWLFLR